MKKVKVYIASPYTIGDTAVNVKRQIDMFHTLRNNGFYPFAPLHSHFLHMFEERGYEDWLEWDFVWLESCNCVLRLDGESSGADREVKHAEELGILVFYSLYELFNYYGIESNAF